MIEIVAGPIAPLAAGDRISPGAGKRLEGVQIADQFPGAAGMIPHEQMCMGFHQHGREDRPASPPKPFQVSEHHRADSRLTEPLSHALQPVEQRLDSEEMPALESVHRFPGRIPGLRLLTFPPHFFHDRACGNVPCNRNVTKYAFSATSQCGRFRRKKASVWSGIVVSLVPGSRRFVGTVPAGLRTAGCSVQGSRRFTAPSVQYPPGCDVSRRSARRRNGGVG